MGSTSNKTFLGGNGKMKKIIALLLAAVLCVSLIPFAFAADDDPAHAEGYTETGDGWTSVVTWMKTET